MVSFNAPASLIGLACLSNVVMAAPFSFPLANGFPNVPSKQVAAVQVQAHGSLPNGGPPPKIAPDTLTSLQLIAFNELFEVAFFTELIANITNNVDGYQIQDGASRNYILQALTAVQAQEELHALNANNAVTHFSQKPILPCKYNFPITSFEAAIGLANTFGDVVLGTLQDVVTRLAKAGDEGLIQSVASVIGQEGQQSGYYRSLQGDIPSALPFLTSSTREFAFSAINQVFAVPGSCPNVDIINLKIYSPLGLITSNSDAKTLQKAQFVVSANSTEFPVTNGATSLHMVYINQQNTPVVKSIENIQVSGDTVTFEAAFPYDAGTFGNGLTITAVTNHPGPFASATDVASSTVFGPNFIEIN